MTFLRLAVDNTKGENQQFVDGYELLKEIKHLHNFVVESLTWKQYQKANTRADGQSYWNEDPSYKASFKRHMAVTKNKAIIERCLRGINMCERLKELQVL